MIRSATDRKVSLQECDAGGTDGVSDIVDVDRGKSKVNLEVVKTERQICVGRLQLVGDKAGLWLGDDLHAPILRAVDGERHFVQPQRDSSDEGRSDMLGE